ncbi:MAG: NAD-dependent epimerase/dehydratase family protein [Anaerolineaceae bacterium]|nr:NAD-dependent epimerase/dehydratase family protein [Anaerolineaceae bacterium]
MRILVTGSTGGIGSWVVKRLLEDGHTLRALDIPAQPINSDYEYLPGDLRNLAVVRQAMAGIEAVVHLAAIPYDVDRQAELVLDTNIHGTYNVLLAAQEAGVRRVVNFSSINALGQAEKNHPGLYLPLDDDIPHYAVNNYELSKHLGEEMCFAFAARGGFSAISLRPTLVTNPGPPRFAWFRMMPEEFKIRSAIGDFWSYVDVRDVAEAAALSLEAKVDIHQAFLLTADDNRMQMPSTEVVEKYYPNLPWPRISKEEYLAKGEFVSLVDCNAAKRVLGWQPKYSQFDPDSGYETQ